MPSLRQHSPDGLHETEAHAESFSQHVGALALQLGFSAQQAFVASAVPHASQTHSLQVHCSSRQQPQPSSHWPHEHSATAAADWALCAIAVPRNVNTASVAISATATRVIDTFNILSIPKLG